jgi:hypothetical protein
MARRATMVFRQCSVQDSGDQSQPVQTDLIRCRMAQLPRLLEARSRPLPPRDCGAILPLEPSHGGGSDAGPGHRRRRRCGRPMASARPGGERITLGQRDFGSDLRPARFQPLSDQGAEHAGLRAAGRLRLRPQHQACASGRLATSRPDHLGVRAAPGRSFPRRRAHDHPRRDLQPAPGPLAGIRVRQGRAGGRSDRGDGRPGGEGSNLGAKPNPPGAAVLDRDHVRSLG